MLQRLQGLSSAECNFSMRKVKDPYHRNAVSSLLPQARENGTDILSRNVRKELPLLAA